MGNRNLQPSAKKGARVELILALPHRFG